MANTGYIINKGIQQVFTSGPNGIINSLVTSSYSSGSTTFGTPVNFKQSFISGAIDYLSPCLNIYNRYYLDPINCPTNGCPPPILMSVTPNCNPYNYEYSITYDYISSSGYVPTTTIQYSTNISFMSNTGSVTYNNTLPTHLPINISDLPLQPLSSTLIYFRAFNSCSINTTSSYSNVISASCVVALPCCTPTLNSITEALGVLTLNWTLGTGGCSTVNNITLQSSTNGVDWVNSIGSSSSPRTIPTPHITTHYRLVSNCSGSSSTPSNIISYIYTPSTYSYTYGPAQSGCTIYWIDKLGNYQSTFVSAGNYFNISCMRDYGYSGCGQWIKQSPC